MCHLEIHISESIDSKQIVMVSINFTCHLHSTLALETSEKSLFISTSLKTKDLSLISLIFGCFYMSSFQPPVLEVLEAHLSCVGKVNICHNIPFIYRLHTNIICFLSFFIYMPTPSHCHRQRCLGVHLNDIESVTICPNDSEQFRSFCIIFTVTHIPALSYQYSFFLDCH